MVNTFDSVTLTKPGMPRYEFPGVANEVILLSGKHSVQSSAEYGLYVTITCKTTSYTDVSNIYAKIGTKGTLVLGSDSFSNMYIQPPISVERLAPSVWAYTIKFVRDTT